jgi:hypothetical protein
MTEGLAHARTSIVPLRMRCWRVWRPTNPAISSRLPSITGAVRGAIERVAIRSQGARGLAVGDARVEVGELFGAIARVAVRLSMWFRTGWAVL